MSGTGGDDFDAEMAKLFGFPAADGERRLEDVIVEALTQMAGQENLLAIGSRLLGRRATLESPEQAEDVKAALEEELAAMGISERVSITTKGDRLTLKSLDPGRHVGELQERFAGR